MTTNDFLLTIPLLIPIVAGVALMLLEPFTPPERKNRLAFFTVLAAALAALSLQFQLRAQTSDFIWSAQANPLMKMLVIDHFSIFFQWLFLIITGVIAVLSMKFIERESMNRGEYYALLLFACSGMSLMAASGDLILTFLGIEILSIATYILAGFKRNDIRSNESSLKYFLLGSFATAILLYGIALIYEGAPTPITAFMAVGPKAAGFAALMRILFQAFPRLDYYDCTSILWILSILTMTLGNIVAVRQTNIKRMLAYSAIAHAGYLLIGIVANDETGISAVLFYLVIYTVMNLVAFSVVLSFSQTGDSRVNLDDYIGLGRRAPFAAAALSLALISLAGIPLTGGFMGKLYLFSAAIKNGYVVLAVIAVLNSVVSVFYYFRLIVYMYMREPGSEMPAPEPIGRPVQAIIAIGCFLILLLGMNPDRILDLAHYSSLALK
jgi:NADH-quinone oxidoreductase subunit N